MSQALILDLTAKTLILVLTLSLPPIIAATVVGLGISLVQALTQVQEQTISFAVKLIVVVAVILFTATWLGSEIFKLADYLFTTFPSLTR